MTKDPLGYPFIKNTTPFYLLKCTAKPEEANHSFVVLLITSNLALMSGLSTVIWSNNFYHLAQKLLEVKIIWQENCYYLGLRGA